MLVALAFGLSAWSRWVEGRGGGGPRSGWSSGRARSWAWRCSPSSMGRSRGWSWGRGRCSAASSAVLAARSSACSLSTIAAGLVAFAVFVALNPFLTAHPDGPLRPERAEVAAKSFLDRLRRREGPPRRGLRRGPGAFPNDALTTLPAKLAAVAIQGYGRFSPLGPSHSDSTRRFDWRQDWGVVIWLPAGRRRGVVVPDRRGRTNGARRAADGLGGRRWLPRGAGRGRVVHPAGLGPLLSLDPARGRACSPSAALTAPFARLRPATEPS